jgi:hypothetical protein
MEEVLRRGQQQRRWPSCAKTRTSGGVVVSAEKLGGGSGSIVVTAHAAEYFPDAVHSRAPLGLDDAKVSD